MTTLELATAATTLPLSLIEIKHHLKLSETVVDDDAEIDAIQAAVVEQVERDVADGLCLLTQTWKQYEDDWPMEIELQRGPVQSITSIEYVDGDGNPQTLASSEYQSELTRQPPDRAVIKTAYQKSWPTIRTGVYNPITITFVAGYGDNWNDVPENVRRAVLDMITHRYDNRGVTWDGRLMLMPHAALAALDNKRLNWFT